MTLKTCWKGRKPSPKSVTPFGKESKFKLKKIHILFECLRNICRSATAQTILKQFKLQIEVDSAGTSGWHIGSAPDERAKSAAIDKGFDISKQQARKLCAQGFQKFDLILAMDKSNQRDSELIWLLNNRIPVKLLSNYAATITDKKFTRPLLL